MSYLAFIAKIDKIEEIAGANTIQKAWVLGSQIIVSKDTQLGDVGIFFPDEGRLSHDYCHHNNLYRHPELNLDKEKSGFFDDNRRVRTQKFMKEKSEGFFAQISSVEYTGYNVSKFKIGDSFDTLNGKKICEKYINEKTSQAIKNRTKKKKIHEIYTEMFPQHFDTEQFRFYKDRLKVGSKITISHKIHGTSCRYGHVKVKRNLTGWKRFIQNFIPIFKEESWQYLAGTRRVDLYEFDRTKDGFHGSEEYRFEILDKLKPFLTKGMVVYGEICGWANNKPIMSPHDITKLNDKNYLKKYGKRVVYSYGALEGEYNFHVYRIAMVQEDGTMIDFSWDQVKWWCETRNIPHVKELVPTFVYDGDIEKLEELVVKLTENEENLCEDYEDSRHILEGVVVRVDGPELTPSFYKNKSFPFKLCEGIAKEKEVDIEDAS